MQLNIPGVAVQAGKWQPDGKTETAYAYALVYRFGSMYLGRYQAIDNWNDVTEARFFDETGELHVWNDGDGWYAATVREDDGASFLDEQWQQQDADGTPLDHTILTVRHYLAADADGQVFPALTRLVSCKEG